VTSDENREPSLRGRVSLNRVRSLSRALGVFLSLAACSDGGTSVPKDPADLEFAPELGVNLDQMTKTSSGLYWQDLVVGTGEEAVSGGWVTVHYTGWLHDGTVFDSTVNGGDPVRFNLSQLIAGWAEGIPGMRVGGKRKLVIPPHLGYGSAGAGGGVIPPNATLVFDIQLMGVG
jgi:FKBP-type peptidyl-prolyl cis-trans isomerase